MLPPLQARCVQWFCGTAGFSAIAGQGSRLLQLMTPADPGAGLQMVGARPWLRAAIAVSSQLFSCHRWGACADGFVLPRALHAAMCLYLVLRMQDRAERILGVFRFDPVYLDFIGLF